MTIANPYLKAEHGGSNADMKLRRLATVASLSVACILIMAKFFAYMVTDSVSLMSSLMDSTFDALASAVMMFSIIHAATPADEEHRFGHGKLEALAAMGQAIFIFGSAAFLLFESIHRFIQPQAVTDIKIGVGVMVLSIILTLGLVTFQRYVIKRTKSVGVSADHLHYKGDLLMNVSVLSALVLTKYTGISYFDPLFAGVISLILLYGAKQISVESFGILMDKELSDEDRQKIIALVSQHAAVRAVHDLRTRFSAHQVFIEFHLELDGDLTLLKAHDITEEIELMLFKEFPKAEVLIHQEPAGIDDHRIDHQIGAR